MTLLAIDPGKNVGWSLWLGDPFIEYSRGVFDFEHIHYRFDLYSGKLWFRAGDRFFQVDEIVVENYIGRPGQKNGGQRFWGPESLAKVEMYGELAHLPVTRQRPVDALEPAIMHSGYKRTAKHLPDQDSAYLHGFYYLETKGLISPVGLEATL